jgi:site-specific recombinase XerD
LVLLRTAAFLGKTVVVRYRMHLESRHLAPGTINLRLGAVRRLAYEAADCGLLSADLAAGIRRVKGVKKLGVRLGNWLTAEQGITLWQAPDRERLKGKRDRALLSVLLACGLRRHEVAELAVDHLRQREGHWAIVNLSGKGSHVRTVPVPDWVYCELSTWMEAAGIKGGRVFRRVSSAGKSWGDGVTEKLAWHVVKEFATKTGVASLAPTTCVGRARVHVGRPEVNWSRFSFSSAMCRSKRLSATSAARNVSPQP